MNAPKSGIDAKAQIIRGEKAANFEALKTEYCDCYHPTTPVQRMLVDTLIDAEWFLLRFRVCEAELWEEDVDMPLRPEEEVELGQAFRFQCELLRPPAAPSLQRPSQITATPSTNSNASGPKKTPTKIPTL
jgi:hypothetical protein